MAQTIKIKRSATSGNKLTGSNSVTGEFGLNTADKSLYIQTGSTDASVVTVYDDGILHLDDTNNRVGIGTTSPTKSLHLNYNNTSTSRTTGNGFAGGVAGDGLLIQNSNTTNNTYANLDFRAATADGRIVYQYTGSQNQGDFHFITDNTNSPATAMTIKNDGKVGIGTTSPTYAFHVDAGNTNTTALFESDGVANVVVSGGNNRGSFVVQHSGTTTGAVIAKDGGGLEFGVGANYATNVGMTLDSSGNLSTGQVTSDDKFTVSTSDWYQFTPGTMSATTASYGMGNGNNPALRQLTFHVPNIAGYSNTGTVPSFGWYSTGADLLMKLESSSGNLTVKGNIVTDSNSTVIAARKIAARDTNGLAIATSDGTSRIDILNSGATRFNNAFTFPTSDGSANQVLVTDGSGNVTWAAQAAASTQSSISDADGDTKIQVEESTDEDKIRFDTGGTERAVMSANNTTFFQPVVLEEPSPHLILKDTTDDDDHKISFRDSSNNDVFIIDTGSDNFNFTTIGASRDIVFRPNQVDRAVLNDSGFALTTAGVTGLVLNEDTSNTQNSARLFFKGSAGTVGLMNVANELSFRTGMTVASTSGTERFNIHTNAVTAQVQFRSVDGNASAPGISFATDTNTGLFRAGADTLSISTAGTERVRVSANGNVGIGTTSPSTKLEVHGTTTLKSQLDFLSPDGTDTISASMLNTDTLSFTGDSGQLFSITDSSTGTIFSVNDISGVPSIEVEDDGTIRLAETFGNVGIGVETPTKKFEVSGDFQVATSTTTNAAYIRNSGTGAALVVNQQGTGDILRVDDNSTTKFIVKDGGRVGIGTTAPTNELHVASGQLLVGSNTGAGVHVNSTGSIEICRTAGNADPFIDFKDDISQDYDVRLQMDDGHFKIANTGGERVRVTSAGRVGILTEVPSDPLHVVGAIRSEGATTSKYLQVAGGNSGNFIDSYANDLFLRPNGTTGQALVVRQGGAAEINGTLRVQAGDATTSAYSISSNGGDLVLKAGADDVVLRTGGSGSEGIYFQDGAQDTKMFIDAESGRVGIGTTSPQAKLDVSGVGNFSTGYNTFAGDGLHIQCAGTSGNGNYAGGISFSRISSDNNTRAAGIAAVQTETDVDRVGLAFFTHDTNTTANDLVEAMRITSTGNVGIGTASPATALDVTGTVTTDGLIVESAADTQLRISDSTSVNQRLDLEHNAGVSKIISGNNSAFGSLEIQSYNGTSTVNRLRVKAGGDILFYEDTGTTAKFFWDASAERLGLGTTAPAEKLDVLGIGKFTGTSESSAVLKLGQRDNSSTTPLHTIYSSDSGSTRPLGGDALEINTGRYLQIIGATRTSAAGADVRSWKFGNATNGNETGTFLALYSQADASSSGSTTTSQTVIFSATSNQNSYINTSGNFGLGTSSPNRKLHLSGSGATVAAKIEATDGNQASVDLKNSEGEFRIISDGGELSIYDQTDTTERFRIDTLGKVGIGTNNPLYQLDVHTTTGTGLNVTDDNSWATIRVDGGGGTDNVLELTNFGTTGSGSLIRTTGGGILRFAAANTEAMRINANGNIAIGGSFSGANGKLCITESTANIASAFHTDGTSWLRIVPNLGTDGYNALSVAGDIGLIFSIDNNVASDSSTQGLFIGPHTNSSTNGLKIQENGNIGIGTNSPSEKLHVAGDVRIDGSTNSSSSVALLVGGTGNGTIKTRHIDGKDFQSTSDGTLHLNYSVSDNVSIARGGGKVQIGSGVPLARLQVEEAGIDTLTTATSSTSQVAIDTFNKGHFRSAEFTIQVTNSTTSKYHLTKILLIHDGTTPNITEYGTIFTGTAAEATFDADISGSNVRLLATPASTNSMTFKVVRHCITV